MDEHNNVDADEQDNSKPVIDNNNLDEELKEADMQNIIGKIREVSNTDEKPVKDKTTKKEYIDKIKSLHDTNNIPFVSSRYTRLNKTQLKEELGKIINEGINQINDEKAMDRSKVADKYDLSPGNKEESQQPVEETSRVYKLNSDLGAKQMMIFNGIFASLVENISKSDKNKLGYMVDGYNTELKNHHDELMEAYKEVYKQHQDELNKYISPVNTIILLNYECLQNSIMKKTT